MRLLLAAGICLAAVVIWTVVVPRLRVDDPEAPDFSVVVHPRSTLAVAAVALSASTVLWVTEPWAWWLWVAYLAFGVPLIGVDATTTFLPLRLHYMTLASMSAASVGLAYTAPRAWITALIGGTATFAFFYVFWRFNPALGFGDVRLAGLVGAVAGQAGLFEAAAGVLVGTLLGATHGIAHTLWAARGADRPKHFAYGPALWGGPLLASFLSLG